MGIVAGVTSYGLRVFVLRFIIYLKYVLLGVIYQLATRNSKLETTFNNGLVTEICIFGG